MVENCITPCPSCGLHAEDSPKAWVCGGCMETGIVKAKYALASILRWVEEGNTERAIEYIKDAEFCRPSSETLEEVR